MTTHTHTHAAGAHLLAQHTIEPTTSAEKTRNWRSRCKANIPLSPLFCYGQISLLPCFLVPPECVCVYVDVCMCVCVCSHSSSSSSREPPPLRSTHGPGRAPDQIRGNPWIASPPPENGGKVERSGRSQRQEEGGRRQEEGGRSQV